MSLYHYTNEKGRNGIEKKNGIKRSTEAGHARHGAGVYLTSMPPNTDPEKLVRNNYTIPKDRIVGDKEFSRVAYCVEVPIANIPKVKKVVDPKNPDKDIYRYPGDLRLEGRGAIFHPK